MKSARGNLDWRVYTTVFVIALAITTAYHLLDNGVKVALLFDGRHYFESCQRVTALILAMASMKPDAVVAAEHALREYIALDGPVLPTLFGSVYALLGRVPTSADWTLIVWVQTILHAIATVLICKITFQLTRKRAVAFICCGLWMMYPAALIASGRLMTESLAVVLLLSLPLALRGAVGGRHSADVESENECGSAEQTSTVDAANAAEKQSKSNQPSLDKLSRLLNGNQYGIVGGVVSGLLILLKPGMIPSVILCWLATLAMSRARFAVALSLIIGAGLAVSPWMLYTKQTTGKAAITVQRMPVHNALIGWDPETSGWQTNPPSGFERVLNTGGEPLSTIEGIWMSHPGDCVTILVEKFGHLYSTPWNDYRTKVFGAGMQLQGAYHYFLLFAALAGVFACILTSERKNKLAILCIAAAGGQCVYLMFEPVCRYAFPQLAFTPVLAALILTMLFKRSRDWKVLAIVAIIAAGCVELIAQSEAASAKRLDEVAHHVTANEKVVANIKFNPEGLGNVDTALLLVDGDSNLEDSQVTVNGTKCDGKLIVFNYYDPQRYQAFNLLKELGYGLNCSVDDFRLWRAIPVPVNVLKDGTAEVTITPNKSGCTIYGDHQNARNYLSPDFLCVNRLINSKRSMEMRNQSPIPSGHCERNWSIQSNGSTSGVLSDNPRIHLLFGLNTESSPMADTAKLPATTTDEPPAVKPPAVKSSEVKSSDYSSTTETAKSPDKSPTTALDKLRETRSTAAWHKDFAPGDFDENMRTPDGMLKISRSILKAARTTAVVQQLPAFDNAKNLEITVEGDVKTASKPGQLGVVIETVAGDSKAECLLARLPSALETKSGWVHFALKDIAPRTTRQGTVNAVSVAFFPGPWQQIAGYGADKKCTDTLIRNLRLSVQDAAIPSLSDKQLLMF